MVGRVRVHCPVGVVGCESAVFLTKDLVGRCLFVCSAKNKDRLGSKSTATNGPDVWLLLALLVQRDTGDQELCRWE